MSSADVGGNPAEYPSRHRDASSHRKVLIRDHADRYAQQRRRWTKRAGYFHEADLKYMQFLIPEGTRVLDLGCATGDLLAALKPAVGVGIDMSEDMIAEAREAHPGYSFVVGDVEDPETIRELAGQLFDFIILSDLVGVLEDCQSTFQNLHQVCGPDTRIIVSYFAYGWQPLLSLAEKMGLKMPQVEQNYLPAKDIQHLLQLSDFDTVKQVRRMIIPLKLLGLGVFINRYLSFLPLVRAFTLRNYTVARSMHHAAIGEKSVSIIIPCRNERGNIAPALQRLPDFGTEQEVIFVEGHSQDGTYEEIERVAAAYQGNAKIRYARQDGIGKGDAMRKGYGMASGDILMILDADLTVAPEDLPKFYRALVDGKGNFINGSRLVYPMDSDAMRFLNLIANACFARLFSFLLNQRISDTLCGTKVLTRDHYDRLAAERDYFGDFDPFGDFDLIFGATKQNMKIVDIPIRYAGRGYGETQISRFRHGVLLLRMVAFAYRKLAAI